MQDAQPLLINIQNLNFLIIFKIAILLVIIIYAIFTFFVYGKIRAMDRIVLFPPRTAASLLTTIALIYFIIIVSLFFITLVIV